MNGMSIQGPVSGGTKGRGYPLDRRSQSFLCSRFFRRSLEKSFCPAFSRSDCTTGGIAKVCNFHPPETVRFTSGVDSCVTVARKHYVAVRRVSL
jgi:hypothetical protein